MPEDIEHILEYAATMAWGYDNHMKWNEEAKLKSDMMRRIDRWRKVTTEKICMKCDELGIRIEDVETICDMHACRLRGRKLVLQHFYKGFEFKYDV